MHISTSFFLLSFWWTTITTSCKTGGSDFSEIPKSSSSLLQVHWVCWVMRQRWWPSELIAVSVSYRRRRSVLFIVLTNTRRNTLSFLTHSTLHKRESRWKERHRLHRLCGVTSQHTYTLCTHHRGAQKTGIEWRGIIYITGLCSFVLVKGGDRHKMR